jgi:hypothetical protein
MSNHHHRPTTEESTPPDDSSFIIHDNSSEIASTKIFPDHFIEPLVILAKIKGYKGIDDYVVHLIVDELKSIRDEGQGIQHLGEYVIKYIAKIIGPDDTSRKEEEGDKRKG